MAGLPPLPAGGDARHDWPSELASLGPRRLKVIWDISNKCNLRCRMCHFAFDDVFHRPAQYMSPELFERLAETVLPNAHTLILSAGNEPLTSPWFADILNIAKQYQVPDLLFITNGIRLTPQIAETVVKSGVTQVQFSIDGSTKQTYEHIRRGAKFETLIKNIKYLSELKAKLGSSTPRLQFNIVLMKSNLHELDGFIDLAESLGVEWIAARHLLMMTGLDVASESLFGDPDAANDAFHKFLARAEASPSVRVISFPDFFDVEARRKNVEAHRESAIAHRHVSFYRPFGYVDTPEQRYTAATGSIVLDGWALDFEALTEVAVERDALPGDTPEFINERGLVPISEARIGIERPDVQAVYPEFERSRVSGWTVSIDRGLLPTGNGISLHVIASAPGRPSVEIGVRRVGLAR